MNVYIDESGQTGCVIKKDEFLNFKDHPTFALAGIVVDNESEEKIKEKYIEFLKKFDIKDEIKGSDMLTKNNNDKLFYFIENILPELKVFINIYDKKFYLSTLIFASFCGLESLELYKFDFYSQASILSKQKDDFFIKYLDFVENPDIESFHDYLLFISNYEYKYFSDGFGNIIENDLVILSTKILDEKLESYFVNDFMTHGWYKDDSIINLINLNCLCELMYEIKYAIKNEEFIFIHDNIKQFEEVIKDELSSQYNLNISFDDSKKTTLLQIADNVVSIFRHLYDKGVYYCNNKKMWDLNSRWDLELFSKIQEMISIDCIKYTVPFSDWSLSLCIKDMFSKDYPINQRNNFFFNGLYTNYLLVIRDSLQSNKLTLNDVNNILDDKTTEE